MPYIDQKVNNVYFDAWDANHCDYGEPVEAGVCLGVKDGNDFKIGEVNYLITKLCQRWLEYYSEGKYADYNAIVGVLECAKLEFYRRAVAKYEDEKIMENGDVYNV